MGRYIVMDIVFYGNSLNYDQGTGNYQELKKITKWDGRQYTLVSRYALRYSLLDTARKMGLWNIADGSKLQRAGEGDQTVIQPSDKILLSGEILKYPEFDLFGYLITTTSPQNFRESPVKISHAVSLTPFSYDALFNANIGLANRMRRTTGGMDPNPFTAEEHETYYQYTIVVNLDAIGKIDIYLAKNEPVEWDFLKIIKEGGGVAFEIKYKKDKKGKERDPLKFKYQGNSNVSLTKIIVPYDEKSKKIEYSDELKDILIFDESIGVMVINYQLKETKNRIYELIKSILNLKRSIKGREEDLSPKLMVVGIYKNNPYKTYKDKISLIDEYCEEEYDEVIEEPFENGRKMKIKHIVSKSKKPVFEVKINSTRKEELSEDKVINFINEIFDKNKDKINQVRIFYDSSIECKIKENNEEERDQ